MFPTAYLAGPITGLRYGESVDWREYATATLQGAGFVGLSPMRGKSFLAGKGPLSAMGYEGNPMSSAKGITMRDRNDVTKRADVVIVNLLGAERVSVGTMIELGWADANRIPIIVAMEDGNVHDHAMVRGVAGYIVPTLDEALDLAVVLLGE